MQMDFDKLSHEIETAARSCFLMLIEQNPGKIFCGFALYSDAAALTVCPAMNSLSNLMKSVECDPDDAVYYRWSVGEWDHEFDGNAFFSGISASLREEGGKIAPAVERRHFSINVYEACVSALERMKNDRFFQSHGRQATVVFSVSDATIKAEPLWIARLNDRASASEFRKWFRSLE
jgi:hypothetical protein